VRESVINAIKHGNASDERKRVHVEFTPLDAGTPGIADPGYHLVKGAVAAGVPVVPVPGASAVTALVSVAGLPAERFMSYAQLFADEVLPAFDTIQA